MIGDILHILQLDDYYNEENERKFLKFMDDEGKSYWNDWKKWNWSDNKEMRKSYKKRKNYQRVQNMEDPGQ